MTTLRAASPLPSRRFILAWVVPPVYALALTLAVMAASGGPTKPQPVGATPVALHLASKRRAATPRHTPRRHALVRHRRTVRRAARPAVRHLTSHPVTTIEVSRSSERVQPVAQPQVEPDLVIRIATIATPETMQAAINACQGPVEIDWADEAWRWGLHPSEIAEHDYCGGSTYTSLRQGERVEVIGGDLSGLYVVDGDRRYATAGAPASTLDGIGDLAIQTCIPGGVILIGLDRVS